MPAFYFYAREGSTLTADDEGMELTDTNAAEAMALNVIVELARGYVSDGANHIWGVEVRDERQKQIFTVTCELSVVRHRDHA